VWPAGRKAIGHLATQPAGGPACHGWVGGRQLDGWVAGWPSGLTGQLASWLAGWPKIWIKKLGSWVRAIQFLEMDDPISDPILRSIFLHLEIEELRTK